MFKFTNKYMRVVILMVMMTGCGIIFESDLSDEHIYVIMPVDDTQTEDQSQLLWWELLDEAIKYNLQIVNGSFSDPWAFVADTNVAGDKFRIDLLPGDYEWRIRGWNNYSTTDFFYHLLTIVDTTTYHEK